jgi:hypothetical protein
MGGWGEERGYLKILSSAKRKSRINQEKRNLQSMVK